MGMFSHMRTRLVTIACSTCIFNHFVEELWIRPGVEATLPYCSSCLYCGVGLEQLLWPVAALASSTEGRAIAGFLLKGCQMG